MNLRVHLLSVFILISRTGIEGFSPPSCSLILTENSFSGRLQHVRSGTKTSPTKIYSKRTGNDEEKLTSFDTTNILQTVNQLSNTQNRRMFFSSVLLSSSLALSPAISDADEITWARSPVNKRSGISVFTAEETYSLKFITYLSRILLSFDEECQRWWYKRAGDIPRTATSEQVDMMRLKQFGQFSASVEVGLLEYDSKEGPALLLSSLLERYGKDIDEVKKMREEKGLPPFKPIEEEKEKREIKEAKRQIALLFGLMGKYQPTEQITKLLASIDNGRVETVQIVNAGGGFGELIIVSTITDLVYILQVPLDFS